MERSKIQMFACCCDSILDNIWQQNICFAMHMHGFILTADREMSGQRYNDDFGEENSTDSTEQSESAYVSSSDNERDFSTSLNPSVLPAHSKTHWSTDLTELGRSFLMIHLRLVQSLASLENLCTLQMDQHADVTSQLQ